MARTMGTLLFAARARCLPGTVLLVMTVAACHAPAPRPTAPAPAPIAAVSRPILPDDAGAPPIAPPLSIPWLPFVHCEAEGTAFTLDPPRPTLAEKIEVRGEARAIAGQAATVYVRPDRPGLSNTYEVAWALRDESGAFTASSRPTALALPNADEERIEILLITRDGVLLERHADEEAEVVLWAAPGAAIARLPELPCATHSAARWSTDEQPEIAVTTSGFVCFAASSLGAAPRFIVAGRDGRTLKSLPIPSNLAAALPGRSDDPCALIDFVKGVAEVHALRGGVRRVAFPLASPPPFCAATAGPESIALQVHARWAGAGATLADLFPTSTRGEATDAVATIEIRDGGLCIRSLRRNDVEAVATPAGLHGRAWLNRGDGPPQTAIACTPSQEPPPGD
jgi:hypothetical protein